MCNGANLAFRKSAFEAVDGYSGNLDVPSGDDEFLMRKIKKTFPQGVIFIPFEDAVVRTVPKESVAAFFAQRIRWAGKWKRNDSYFAKFLALYVFAVQIAFVGLIVLMILPSIGVSFKIVVSAILVFRFAMEAIFLRSVCRFLQVKWRWSAYVLVQLFYPYYVAGTGLFSNFMSVTWKNRRII
jgi:poly-beta-1,6-N-acetyl-D-glucosamine synthase